MRIYNKSGSLEFKVFDFPDGQPHFELLTDDSGWPDVTIEAAIKNPKDLFMVVLVARVLHNHFDEVNLNIRYLMGARMDRAIDYMQPFTLETVGRIIKLAGFNTITVLDPHSHVAEGQLKWPANYKSVLPRRQFEDAVVHSCPGAFIIPDRGATPRVRELARSFNRSLIQCTKIRDSQTGKLSGFEIVDPDRLRGLSKVMIVDDICDGGGTFSGIAKEIHKVTRAKVDLFITHGIFSKPLPLEGINHIYCTDSLMLYSDKHVTVIPVNMENM